MSHEARIVSRATIEQKRGPQVSEQSVLGALSFGIGVIGEQKDVGLLLSQANPYLLEIFGKDDDTLLPLQLDDITDLVIDPAFCGAMNEVSAGNENAAFLCPLSVGGESCYFSGELRRLDTGAAGQRRILLTLIDYTSEERHRNELVDRALHDPLTGLPNYGYFTMKVDEALETRESPGAIAVMMLNLNRFQAINESLGYGAGDILLKEIAGRFDKVCPEGGILARFNSDEFALFADNTGTESSAHALARDLHNCLCDPIIIEDQKIHLTASIGIALFTDHIHNSEDLVRNAGTAMHRAKSEGRGRSVIYHHDLRKRARSLFTLEADLRQAIESEALELHYQPICNLNTGEVTGFEALARWNHPEHGAISPADFIAVAENSGLIAPLGGWALREACSQLATWDRISGRAASLSVNVNVSGLQFGEPDFVDMVRTTLNEAGLSGNRIRLEITESTIMTNPELVADLLLDLKALGICLAVDDFGTGYSSLSYLTRFPIDTLKIDRVFVSKLTNNEDDAKIVHIVTMLAQTLGMTVVAEGIETQAQLDRLGQLGCPFGQGYFFSKPLPASDATNLLRTGATLPVTD